MLTIIFCKLLQEEGISFVIVSGYTAILFGRSRNSEDVDLFIEPLTKKRFSRLWRRLKKKFICLNTDKEEEAYAEYFTKETGLRFSHPNTFVPNIEVKKPVGALEAYTLKERIPILLNKKYRLAISPIELQIAYKYYLGSEKDIEDAKHLLLVFKEFLNQKALQGFLKRLGVTADEISED